MLSLALVGLVLVLGSFSARSIMNMQHQAFVIYSVNRSGVIDFIQGRQAWCVWCRDQETGPVNMDYQVAGNRLQRGVKMVMALEFLGQEANYVSGGSFSRKGSFIKFGDKHMYLLDQDCPKSLSEAGFKIDYLVISQNPRHDAREILECLHPDLVVVDASNFYWIAQRWKEACREAGIECWDTRKKGAFAEDFNQGFNKNKKWDRLF